MELGEADQNITSGQVFLIPDNKFWVGWKNVVSHFILTVITNKETRKSSDQLQFRSVLHRWSYHVRSRDLSPRISALGISVQVRVEAKCSSVSSESFYSSAGWGKTLVCQLWEFQGIEKASSRRGSPGGSGHSVFIPVCPEPPGDPLRLLLFEVEDVVRRELGQVFFHPQEPRDWD